LHEQENTVPSSKTDPDYLSMLYISNQYSVCSVNTLEQLKYGVLYTITPALRGYSHYSVI